jgi:hypothetical protein
MPCETLSNSDFYEATALCSCAMACYAVLNADGGVHCGCGYGHGTAHCARPGPGACAQGRAAASIDDIGGGGLINSGWDTLFALLLDSPSTRCAPSALIVDRGGWRM